MMTNAAIAMNRFGLGARPSANLPVSPTDWLKSQIEKYDPALSASASQPSRASIAAGFPSPAEDHQVERIDLMQQLVKHPQATFYIRVRGESMRDAGILDGSVVLVDRAITPADGQIVLAVIDGDFTCKTLRLQGEGIRLQAAHPHYPDIVPKDGQSVEIWGVVVATIHQHQT